MARFLVGDLDSVVDVKLSRFSWVVVALVDCIGIDADN